MRKRFPGNGLSVKKLICSLLLFSALCYWGAQARGETTVYFGDTNGSYPIQVDKNEEFLVVLWISSVVELAGYEAKITYSGPIALNASAAHGSWLADGHTVWDSTIRGDAIGGILTDPEDITGSGELCVFSFTADDEDGEGSVSIVSSYFVLGDTDAEEIVVTDPSTIYIIVGTGGDSPGGGGDDTDEDPGGGGGGGGGEDSGTVYYVDGINGDNEDAGDDPNEPWKTISYAITEASSGDEIRVSYGSSANLTYSEELTIGESLDISGGWNPSSWVQDKNYACIISGDNTDPTVRYTGAGTAGSISNFNITGGTIGIHCVSISSLKITANTVTGNSEQGIFCQTGAAPEIRENLITDNERIGLECQGDPIVTAIIIADNVITNNTGNTAGGIRVWSFNNVAPVIERNIIKGNTSDTKGGGVTFYLVTSVVFRNNVIAENTADDNGGGISCTNSTMGIYNNTIVDNYVADESEELVGGGLYVGRTSGTHEVTVRNCIFWDNKSNGEGGDRDDEIVVKGSNTTVDVDYCDVNGGESSYCAAYNDATKTWGSNNITANPKLDGYDLQSDSPCIDAGTCIQEVLDDIKGLLRPADGNDDNAAKYDIGAHEYGARVSLWPIPGDANLDCAVNILDMLFVRNRLHNPATAHCDEDDGIWDWQADVKTDGIVNILDLIYVRNHLQTYCE